MTKKEKFNYERNAHVLKIMIEAVILCVDQVLTLRGAQRSWKTCI